MDYCLNQNYFRNIQALLCSKELCDIKLHIDSEIIDSNKFLLASQSKVFRTNFEMNNKCEQWDSCDEIDLRFPQDIPLWIFKVLHKFIFTGVLNLSKLDHNRKYQLYRLADFYQFDDIIVTMAKHFASIIDENCCFDLIKLAANYYNASIAQRTAQFISYEFNDVSVRDELLLTLSQDVFTFLISCDTFYMDEMQIAQLCIKWQTHHQTHHNSEIMNALRLQLMSPSNYQFLPQHIVQNYNNHKTQRKKYRYLCPLKPLIFGENFESTGEVLDEKSGKSFPRGNAVVVLTNKELVSTIIKLKQIYLINHISMKFASNEIIPYSLEVSADMTNWRVIVDYLQNKTHGYQEVYFESQEVMFVKIRATNIIRTQLRLSTDFSDSNSMTFLNIDHLEMKLEENTSLMRMIDGYLVPSRNISHDAIGTANTNNLSCDMYAFIKEKYRNPFQVKYPVIDCNNNFKLTFQQPVLLSTLKLTLYDKKSSTTGLVRYFNYRIEVSINEFDWNVVYEQFKDVTGYQFISFKPIVAQHLRIIATGVHNFKKANNGKFTIVNFECP